MHNFFVGKQTPPIGSALTLFLVLGHPRNGVLEYEKTKADIKAI